MYYVILYDSGYIFPIGFNTFEEADNFIFENNFHAFITIMIEEN